ncbi:MFS transporter [Streptomyces sp. NPDC059786]|uniref:MFS transporter n=1 Tax=Streptomyces sp. NPDC059786 TaxID=3346946 RepID=UPI00365EDBD2
MLLSTAGLLCLVWAVIESPARGWTSGPVLAAFGAAGVLLAAFLLQQTRHPDPMLPLALLREPRIGAAAAVIALMAVAVFGSLFIVALYLQQVLGHSPWEAGLRSLPLPLALGAGAALAVPLISRCGPRATAALGLTAVAAAFVVLADTGPADGFPHLAVFQVLAGLGSGMTGTAGTESVMATAPVRQLALGSAINDVTRAVGSALGVAVQGSVLAAVSTARLHDVLGPYAARLPAHTDATTALADPSRGAGLPPSAQEALRRAYEDAFLHGMTASSWVAVTVTLTATTVCLVALPRRLTPANEGAATPIPPASAPAPAPGQLP